MRKKKTLAVILVATLSLCACGKSTPQAQEEAEKREDCVSSMIEEVVGIEEQLQTIAKPLRKYVDFSEEFLDNGDILSLCSYFDENEEWENVYEEIYALFLDEDGYETVSDLEIERLDKNTYRISYEDEDGVGTKYECSYDEVHKWLSIEKSLRVEDVWITENLYEVAKNATESAISKGDTIEYWVQTQSERMYASLDDDKKILECSFSKLNGKDFKAVSADEEILYEYGEITDAFEYPDRYSRLDSEFNIISTATNKSELKEEFVFANKDHSEFILEYKKGSGVGIQSVNKITGKLEKVEITKDKKVKREVVE